jgi:hypothetical protein
MDTIAFHHSAGAADPHPLTDLGFCTWVGQALPGERLVYHHGFLATDLQETRDPDRRRLRGLGQAAYRAFEAGLVHLVQVRFDRGGFAYVAIARPKPRVTPVPFAKLIAAEVAG